MNLRMVALAMLLSTPAIAIAEETVDSTAALGMTVFSMPAAGGEQVQMTARGVVVDETGSGLQGVWVDAFCAPQGQPDDASVSIRSEITGVDGRFTVRNLPAGECSLLVYAPWGTCMSDDDPSDPCARTSVDITVRTGLNIEGLRLQVPKTSPTGAVYGRALDARGGPLAHYEVTVACGESTKGVTTATRTGGDGAFSLRFLPAGRCVLRLAKCSADEKPCTPLSSIDPFSPCQAAEACADVTVVAGAELRDVVLRTGEAR